MLAAPSVPWLRLTVIAIDVPLCATEYVEALNASEPGLVAPPPAVPLPLIVIVDVEGEPSVAPPVAPESAIENALLPMKGVASLIATVNVFAAESLAAQLSVPVVLVNSVPAVAVPATVA